MPDSLLFRKQDNLYLSAVLRLHDEWGLKTADLVRPPRRFWGDQAYTDPLVEEGVDLRRVEQASTPAEILATLPPEENWQAQTRKSLARLHAFHLICGDPQRRLDVRSVETLSHQVSLVRHILESDRLLRVLVADEVGLGKTIEVGLILRELLTQKAHLRILYLAPARLVSNVRRELDRLDLPFRQWTASEADARLSDPHIIASVHKAVAGSNKPKLVDTAPWDVLVVDECHHLTAWSPDGKDASEAYKLVQELVDRQPKDGRVILMSGTPHQGHRVRFDNLLLFLKGAKESPERLSGRVIYRTKDDIKDWEGHPVFPNRQVNEPLMVDLGPQHRQWLTNIHDFYKPDVNSAKPGEGKKRAAGWRCAQAMQWATSSPQAGLGYLVRQALRAHWNLENQVLIAGLTALRPYRLGTPDEPIDHLFHRMLKEVARQQLDADVDDIEDSVDGANSDPVSVRGLEKLIEEGIAVIQDAGQEKWEFLRKQILETAGDEKIVFFAQPIETVTALARFLERITGRRPALILGGQEESERNSQVDLFRRSDGAQFLVSSRAGGEGINLQVARRLVHIDVPWNPMEMEQRVGRVHRFGSRETIIVDTLVVKDSREADAFRIAREKLKLITQTLVEKERFEAVFSRVMSLLSQDELQGLMLDNLTSPMDAHDEQRLQAMIQEGFQTWKDFHHRFGEQQKAIQRQDPGSATWDTLASFLEQYGGAVRQPGHRVYRFAHNNEDDATVLRLSDGEPYVCGDYGEALVHAPDGSVTAKCGLNRSIVAEVLRKAAFSDRSIGAAHLRWPTDIPLPQRCELPFAVVAILRQTVRMDQKGGWTEQSASLHVFVCKESECVPLDRDAQKSLIEGLLAGMIRRVPENLPSLYQAAINAERHWGEALRRPTEDDLQAKVRHSTMPLLAAIVVA